MGSAPFSLALGLVVVATGAAPQRPPTFWSVGRCETVVHAQGPGATTRNGWVFSAGLVDCVGTGGPKACIWAGGHRSRLYSEFTVFSRARYIGGIVRSWTLATHGGPGFVREGGRRHPDYYMSPLSVKLLASHSTPQSFRALVAPNAAAVERAENEAGCAA